MEFKAKEAEDGRPLFVVIYNVIKKWDAPVYTESIPFPYPALMQLDIIRRSLTRSFRYKISTVGTMPYVPAAG